MQDEIDCDEVLSSTNLSWTPLTSAIVRRPPFFWVAASMTVKRYSSSWLCYAAATLRCAALPWLWRKAGVATTVRGESKDFVHARGLVDFDSPVYPSHERIRR